MGRLTKGARADAATAMAALRRAEPGQEIGPLSAVKSDRTS